MASWQPPIPSGALYSPHAIALGPGLALLAWCYDRVERDGSVQIQLETAAEDIGKPYGTVRDWWKAMRGSDEKPSPFFSQIVPQGRKGWRVKFKARWIDWRIVERNYPDRRDFSDEETNTADIPAMNEKERNSSDEHTNGAVLSDFSSQFHRRDLSDENNVYGTHDDHESSPPTSFNAVAKNGHKPIPNREMVMMLISKGVGSEEVANEIASMGLDYQTVEQSIDNMLADGKTQIGAVIKFLRSTPPEPGKPYQRSRASPKNGIPVPTKPLIPPDMLTPQQIAERSRAKRAERDTS